MSLIQLIKQTRQCPTWLRVAWLGKLLLPVPLMLGKGDEEWKISVLNLSLLLGSPDLELTKDNQPGTLTKNVSERNRL